MPVCAPVKANYEIIRTLHIAISSCQQLHHTVQHTLSRRNELATNKNNTWHVDDLKATATYLQNRVYEKQNLKYLRSTVCLPSIVSSALCESKKPTFHESTKPHQELSPQTWMYKLCTNCTGTVKSCPYTKAILYDCRYVRFRLTDSLPVPQIKFNISWLTKFIMMKPINLFNMRHFGLSMMPLSVISYLCFLRHWATAMTTRACP